MICFPFPLSRFYICLSVPPERSIETIAVVRLNALGSEFISGQCRFPPSLPVFEMGSSNLIRLWCALLICPLRKNFYGLPLLTNGCRGRSSLRLRRGFVNR